MHVTADDLTREAADERNVRVTRHDDGVELYFPPLRSIEAALPLAAFGAIAAAIPAVAIAALLPSLLANAGTLLGAVLIASFVLPFFAFGAVFVALALYMVANALHVRITASAIDTARILFGVVVRRHHVVRGELTALEPQIASRYQGLFGGPPSYHLVARTSGGRRIVVAETLRGEAAMERVKALVENSSSSGAIDS